MQGSVQKNPCRNLAQTGEFLGPREGCIDVQGVQEGVELRLGFGAGLGLQDGRVGPDAGLFDYA